MTANTSSPAESVSEDFWTRYRALLSQQRMTPNAARWHERRARHFVWNRDRRALAALTGEEVSGYVRQTHARGVLEEWQLVQIVDAVEILCRGLLGLSWAGDFDWKRWKQPHLACPGTQAGEVRRLGSGFPSPPESGGDFADGAASREAFRQHPEAFQGLRAELRARHYSLQTERAYGNWLARFLAFHRCAAPESLKAPDVKAYLEYLATVREVSASTQNQALCALVFFYGQVLQRPLGVFGDFAKAKRPIRVPQVLSRDEFRRQEELLGHKDVFTTMIYTHVLNRPGLAVRSPADL